MDWKRIQYWYYRNWRWMFDILFWVIMLVAFAILLSLPRDECNIYVGLAILGPAVVFGLAIGNIMSWLAERFV